MSQDPFEHIAEILRNHEVRPSQNASFEEVMNRRRKKRRGFFWWFQRSMVGALLLGVAGGIAFFNRSNIPASGIENTSSTPNVSLRETESRLSNSSKLVETDIQPPAASASNAATKARIGTKNQLAQNSKKQTANTGLFGLFQTFNAHRKQISGNHPKTLGALSNPSQERLDLDYKPNKTSPNNTDIYAQGGSPMSLANVYDFGAKMAIGSTIFEFNLTEQPDNYIDWNFELPSMALRTRKLPWYVEFSAITGSDNQVQFDGKENLSVLGTNYMAQYQMSLLREFKGANMWGLGLQYTQWVGNGEWRKREFLDILHIDTQTVAINVPGLPTQYVTYYDTQTVQQSNISTGQIKYNIDKFSLPISHRGYIRLLKTNFRYAAQIAPGFIRSSRGAYFSPTEYMPIDKTTQLSLGAKVGMGPIIPVGNGVSIVIEPAMMYESFWHPSQGLQGNVFGGLGISMLWRLK